MIITSVIYLTAGTLLMMWLGEQITQRGIGNGASLFITVGILATFRGRSPQTKQFFSLRSVPAAALGAPLAVVMIRLLFLGRHGVFVVSRANEKFLCSMQRVVGNKMMGGQSSFLPLKVNYSGVMPGIFAQAILLFPQQIFRASRRVQPGFLSEVQRTSARTVGLLHVVRIPDSLLQLFWVSVMFKPVQIAIS